MSAGKTSLYLVHSETGQRYPIRGTVVIGRGAADIVFVHDAKLSPQHCRITVTKKGLAVQDIRSTSGTHINGKRISPDLPVFLAPGKSLRVGGQEFVASTVVVEGRRRKRKGGRSHGLGPEQLAGHLLIALNIALYIWNQCRVTPLLLPTNEPAIRVIGATFFHQGLWGIATDMLLLATLSRKVAQKIGGKLLFAVYFFSGVMAGVAASILSPTAIVPLGCAGAVCGVGGAWLALQLIGRLKTKEFTPFLIVATVIFVLNLMNSAGDPISLFTMAAGLSAGFFALLAIELSEAAGHWLQEAQVAFGLTLLCLGVVTQIPDRDLTLTKAITPVPVAELYSPFQLVEREMKSVLEDYETLGGLVQNKKISENEMSEVIHRKLLPSLKALEAKFTVLRTLSEADRRKVSLDRQLINSLVAQVTAMGKFADTHDAKYEREIERMVEPIEKLNAELKQTTQPPKKARLPAGN